ncbi:major facilitator superfamily domain-containing protein [Fennellomyces sp. T-0311]|nr:major facilitator superfamily domain-containing protein [Fennellomyces sp. T-0311]
MVKDSTIDQEKKTAVVYDDDAAESGASSTDSKSEDFVEPDEKELKRLMWKLDLRIIPYVCILYLCSYLDRVNIGHAKIAGIMDEIDITESQYSWSLSIFFIGYVIFEVPGNLMLKWLGPRMWISIIMIIWGAILAAMAAVRNGKELMVARFFLGVAEAGLYPGVLYYLSVWYTRKQTALRVAFFYASNTLAGAFGGLLAYGIMHMDGLQGLSGWQWIFIIEAIPTLFFAVVTYFYLPDMPEKATFLNERERAIILNQNRKDAGPALETHFSWNQVWSTFLDWKTFAYSFLYIVAAIPVYTLSLFMPSIVNGMGYQALTAQAMTTPPYICAFFMCILNSWSAGRRNERGAHMALAATLALIGYILLIVLRNNPSEHLYAGAIIATTGTFGMMPAFVSWFGNNYGGHTRRNVAIATIASIGNCGGIISGQVYRADDGPHYITGHTINLALMAFCVVGPLAMKYVLHRINVKRINMSPEEYQKAAQGEELGEKHPGFRYIT